METGINTGGQDAGKGQSELPRVGLSADGRRRAGKQEAGWPKYGGIRVRIYNEDDPCAERPVEFLGMA